MNSYWLWGAVWMVGKVNIDLIVNGTNILE